MTNRGNTCEETAGGGLGGADKKTQDKPQNPKGHGAINEVHGAAGRGEDKQRRQDDELWSHVVIDKPANQRTQRSEEHTSELQSRFDLVCRLLLDKKYVTISSLMSNNNN